MARLGTQFGLAQFGLGEAGGANLNGTLMVTLVSLLILIGSMLKVLRDSIIADGGVVILGFLVFSKEDSPWEGLDFFLKANLIDSSNNLIAMTLNRG